jgi:hypothetical protein
VAEPTKRRRDEPMPGVANMPSDANDWLDLPGACSFLAVSRVRVHQLVREGRLTRFQIPGANKGEPPRLRFDPAELSALVDELEADKEDAAAQPAPPVALATPGMPELLRATVDGLRAAQAHAERLVTLFDGPYKFVLETLREENAAQRAELQVMRKERVELEAQREEFRSTRSAEAIVEQEVKASADLKREAVGMAKKLALHMLHQQSLKDGIDPKLVMLRDAIASIPRESIEVAFKMGVIPPDAEAKLRVALDWADDDATEQPSNGVAS